MHHCQGFRASWISQSRPHIWHVIFWKTMESGRSVLKRLEWYKVVISFIPYLFPSFYTVIIPYLMFFGLLTELKSVTTFIIGLLPNITLTLQQMTMASISSKVSSWLLEGLFSSILRCPCLNRIGMLSSLTLFWMSSWLTIRKLYQTVLIAVILL